MAIRKEDIETLVTLDGVLLDEKKFAEWLELYHQHCVFWVPAWDDDLDQQTTDPNLEISLIYYDNRAGLEDRIYRIGTQRSSASRPLFRTAHFTSNLHILEQGENTATVRVSWSTHAYRNHKSVCYFGNTIYKLVAENGQLKIHFKRINLLNDYFEDAVDFYLL